MDIAVTGSSGLIGTALTRALEADGHRVLPVVRSGRADGTISWDPAAGTIDAAALEGLDAVVHLAGEGIASGPWTAKQRGRIHDSRAHGTRLLADTLADLARPPAVLVSGSAIGYYGSRGDEVLTESSSPGDGFLPDVCVAWEAATAPAATAGIRTVHVRTGIVLDPAGGSLGKQLLAFRLGLGARAGNGRQWLSWISLADEVAAIRHALDHPTLDGPVNLTAPNPVTNAEFTEEVAAALHRPAFLVIPRATRRLPFWVGPLVDSLLFDSARVRPDALLASDFEFAHPELVPALDDILATA
jgi:uncharacterized protein